jgi:hypothetical protein
LQRQDEFGQRYTLDFAIQVQNRNAVLRSGWIIEQDSEIPKLTTRSSIEPIWDLFGDSEALPWQVE